MHVLFVGNSFTICNNLPEMFRTMTEHDGLDVLVDSVMKGGAYLHEFLDETHEFGAALRAKYAERSWDAVILQDQSFNPAENPADHIESVKKLAAEVFTNGEKIYLYQTWAYRDGSEMLSNTGMTYEQMRRALRDGYAASAAAVNGVRVPIGDAFALASAQNVEMYREDDYHPFFTGTYLAAYLFFRYIFGKAPAPVAITDKIDQETMRILGECAEKVCEQ